MNQKEKVKRDKIKSKIKWNEIALINEIKLSTFSKIRNDE